MIDNRKSPSKVRAACVIPRKTNEVLLAAALRGGYAKAKSYRLAIRWAVSDPAFILALEEGELPKVDRMARDFFKYRDTYLTKHILERFIYEREFKSPP